MLARPCRALYLRKCIEGLSGSSLWRRRGPTDAAPSPCMRCRVTAASVHRIYRHPTPTSDSTCRSTTAAAAATGGGPHLPAQHPPSRPCVTPATDEASARTSGQPWASRGRDREEWSHGGGGGGGRGSERMSGRGVDKDRAERNYRGVAFSPWATGLAAYVSMYIYIHGCIDR